MKSCVLYDDGMPVPEAVRQVTGLRRFGDILFRQTTQKDRCREAARIAGWDKVLHIFEDATLMEEVQRVRQLADTAGYYVLLPAQAGWNAASDEMAHFLRNLLVARENVVARCGEITFAACTADRLPLLAQLRASGDLRRLLSADFPEFPEIPVPVEMVDLSDFSQFTTFFTGAFMTRHFNSVQRTDDIIVKRSKDKAKIKREYTFLSLVPEALRRYFVPAFDYKDEGEAATYAMERFYVPDVAIQWVHGSIDEQAAGILMPKLQKFLEERPVKTVSADEGRKIAKALYEDKVRARIDALTNHDGFTGVDRALRLITGGAPLEALLERYLALQDTIAKGRTYDRLAFTHGDLCFSNILFSRETRLMKLIDVRGTDDEKGLYSDWYYDLAKLSHSVLGGYDFINNGLATTTLTRGLGLEVTTPAFDHSRQKAIFVDMVEALGFDMGLVRLYEASLFLSMLPLHMDYPDKVVQFAATAARLIEALETGDRDVIETC